MANWEAYACSNYFKVKDPEAFKAWVNSVPGLDLSEYKERGMFGFIVNGTDTGGLPNFIVEPEDETEDNKNRDWVAEIPDLLETGQVAILFEIGHEKLRYVSGGALAIGWDKRGVRITLDDIYQIAKEHFGPAAQIDKI
jgi:hypothetical protein